MRFARTNLRRQWCPEVSMVDASLAGYGVDVCQSSSPEVEPVGRFDERWRFKKEYIQDLLVKWSMKDYNPARLTGEPESFQAEKKG